MKELAWSLRVVNRTARRVDLDWDDLSESDALRMARHLAETLAAGYGDRARAEAREFPFVAAPGAEYDEFAVELYDRDDRGRRRWRRGHDVGLYGVKSWATLAPPC